MTPISNHYLEYVELIRKHGLAERLYVRVLESPLFSRYPRLSVLLSKNGYVRGRRGVMVCARASS